MTHPVGISLGGIRTSGDLRLRCHIHGDDDCWHWRGAVDKRGTPKVWFAPFGVTTTIGPVIGFLRTGSRPKKAVWLSRCMTPDCVNPAHWGPSTHSAATRRKPRLNPVLHQINVTKARRAQSKLTDEAVEDIRSSTDTLEQCAARHGISRSTVHRIRKRLSWKTLNLIPGSSVFSLGALA